jgi:hypothetical protein
VRIFRSFFLDLARALWLWFVVFESVIDISRGGE